MKRLYTYRNKDRKCRKQGFTLVEVIAVLVIIAIVAAFATPGIVTYMKNMRQVRQDDTVRLLYSAAQNRLTYLSGHDPDGEYAEFRKLFVPEGDVGAQQGFVGGHYKGSGTGGTDSIAINVLCGSDNKPIPLTEDGKIVYSTSGSGDGSAAVGTAISGGSANMRAEPIGVYHIPADKDDLAAERAKEILLGESGMLNAIEPGEVEIDVDLTLRFILQVRYKNSYMAAPSIYNESNVVVPDSADVKTETLQMSVYADNGEELLIHVTCDSLKDYTVAADKFILSMTMTGGTCGVSKDYTLVLDNSKAWFCETPDGSVQYEADITLDSLKENLHFADIFGADGFIPGEDISATFQLFYNGGLKTTDNKPVVVNPSALSTITVNSLFADVKENDGAQTAYLANGRHLQNLANCAGVAKDPVTAALQYGDIDWTKTQDVYGDTFALVPIVNDNIVKFDGANGTAHTISNLRIDGSKATTNTGMFDTTDAAFSNVQLVKPTVVSGKGNVGTLAGKLTGGKIEDCVITNPSVTKSDATTEGVGGLVGAVMPADGETAKITGCGVYITDTTNLTNYNVTATNGTAGGLVGVVSGEGSTEITTSFAAVNSVSGGASVGGLIGSIAGKTKVESCYADTKTISGTTSVGGFAGSVGADATVSYSYAVTEVLRANPTGGTAAGFAASNAGSIDHSYALVGSVLTGDETNGCKGATRYGFAPGTASKCYYYATREFMAVDNANHNEDQKVNSVSKLTETVYHDAQNESVTGKWEYDVYPENKDGHKAGETKTTAFSYPYQCAAGTAYEYMKDTAYPAPRIAGIDHYGNWPEAAVKYTILFHFVDDALEEDALAALKAYNSFFETHTIEEYNIQEGNAIEDYLAGETITCPPILKEVSGAAVEFNYTDSSNAQHQFVEWTTYLESDGAKPVVVNPTALTDEELIALAVDNVVTIYARWTGQYNVIYNANLPSSAALKCTMPLPVPYFPGEAVTITDSVKVNKLEYRCEKTAGGVLDTAYLFAGWNRDKTAANAGTVEFLPGKENAFEMPSSKVDVYAVWVKAPTVSYDANLPTDAVLSSGAQALPEKTAYADGGTVNLTTKIAVKDKTFTCEKEISGVNVPFRIIGWNTDQTKAIAGEVQYALGKTSSFTIHTADEDVVLYAVWERMYNVTFDVNMPESGMTASSVPADHIPALKWWSKGDTASYLNTPVVKAEDFRYEKGGRTYLFTGWSETDDATTATYVPDADGKLSFTMPAKEEGMVLYAVWKPALLIHYEKNDPGQKMTPKTSYINGAPPADEYCFDGETVTVADDGTLTYSGKVANKNFKFIGWAKTDAPTDNKPDYTAGNTFTAKESDAKDGKITLYAVWENIANNVEISVLLDGEPWHERSSVSDEKALTDPKVTICISDNSKPAIACEYTGGVYQNMEDVEVGKTYDVYVDGVKITGHSFKVQERVTSTAEVNYYTIITRGGDEWITETTQSGGNMKKQVSASLTGKVVEAIYLEGTNIKAAATPADNFRLWVYTLKPGEVDEITVSTTREMTITPGDSGFRSWPLDLSAKSTYSIIYAMIGVKEKTKNTNPTTWKVGDTTNTLTATFLPEEDYTLPDYGDAIVVSRNGVVLTKETDYIWAKKTEGSVTYGELTIPGAKITDNITVRLNGIPRIYNLYYDQYMNIAPDAVIGDYNAGKGSGDLFDDAPYWDTTWNGGAPGGDTIIHGVAEGNLTRVFNEPGYVTIRPDEYYSLPANGEIRVWSVDYETDAAGKKTKYSRTLLTEEYGGIEGAYTYSYADPEMDVDYNTGVIVLQEEEIPGRYVVIEAECIPTEYTIEMKLSGADAVDADGNAFDTTVTHTHFDADNIEFYVKPWTKDDGKSGDYLCPTDIVVRMGSKVVGTGKYAYHKDTGKVTIFGHNDTDPDSGVTGNITVTAVAKEDKETTTVYVYKDGKGWNDRKVELVSGSDRTTLTAGENGAYIFPEMTAGDYQVYIDDQNVNKTVAANASTTVYFYSLELTAGEGIQSVSIENVGSAHVFAGEGTTAQTFLSGAKVLAKCEVIAGAHRHFDAWYKDGKTVYSASEQYKVLYLRSHLRLTAVAAADTLTILYRDYDLTDPAHPTSAAFSGVLPENAPTVHSYGTTTVLPEAMRVTKSGYQVAEYWINTAEGFVRSQSLDDVDILTDADYAEPMTIEVCASWVSVDNKATLLSGGALKSGILAPGYDRNTGWRLEEANKYSYRYSTDYPATLPKADEITAPGTSLALLGYLVTEGADGEVWPKNTVLAPGSRFGAYGNVTIEALWGEVGTLDVEVLKDNKDWTHHGQKIELVCGSGTASDPYFRYTLENVDDYRESYISRLSGIKVGTYTVVVNGKATDRQITVQKDNNHDILNFYTVTYYPHADNYTGDVPVDGTYYLFGEQFTVMNNVGQLQRLNTTTNTPSGTLAGWLNNASFDMYKADGSGAKLYAMGEEYVINDPVNLYALWVTGQAGVIYVKSDGKVDTTQGAGWDLTTGKAMDDNGMKAVQTDGNRTNLSADNYYLFYSKNGGIDGIDLLKMDAGDRWRYGGDLDSGHKKTGTDYVFIKVQKGENASLILYDTSKPTDKVMLSLNGAWNEDGIFFSTKWLLNYSGNGSDGGNIPPTEAYSDLAVMKAMIAEPTMTREGYRFTGWNTKKDGSGKTYQPGDLMDVLDNVTLYAQWEGVTYTVKFVDSDGTTAAHDPVTMTAGTPAELPIATTNPYATFVGWALAEEPTLLRYPAGTAAQDLATEAGAVVTLRAVWEYNPANTLTYKLGNANWRTQEGYSDIQVPVIDEIPENDKPFLGWESSKEPGRLYQPGEAILVDTDFTLTAQWGKNVRWLEGPNWGADEWYSTLGEAVDSVNTKTGNKTKTQHLVFYGDTTETANVEYKYSVTTKNSWGQKKKTDYTVHGIVVKANIEITTVGDYTTYLSESLNINDKYNFLIVEAGWVLTLGSNDGMDGHQLTFDAIQKGRLVRLIGNNTTLEMYDGVTLTKGKVTSDGTDYGAGVYVGSGTKFYMYGGTISDCTVDASGAESGGGGVYVAPSQEVNDKVLTGGFMQMGDQIKIPKNSTEYPYSSTTTYYRIGSEMGLPKTDINYNYYMKADGVTKDTFNDGTYAIVTGTPTIIRCSTTKGDGGGIFCGDLEMDCLLLYSGTISENSAGNKGGGIRTDSLNSGAHSNADVYLRIYEIDVAYNTANIGGALFQWQGTLLIMNSDMHHNQATRGGAIFIDCYKAGERSLMEFYNGRIHDNVATEGAGGAIYMGGGSGKDAGGEEGDNPDGNGYTAVTLHNGSLYNNHAETEKGGGGIHVGRNCGVCTLNGGNIYDNTIVAFDEAGKKTTAVLDIYVDNKDTGSSEPVDDTKYKGHEKYLLSTNTKLSESLNTSEAAQGKQIVVVLSDGNIGSTVVQYAKVTWDSGPSNYHYKTGLNVSTVQAWNDADCFRYGKPINSNPAAIKPVNPNSTKPNTADQGSLILARGYQLQYTNGGDSTIKGIPTVKRYYAKDAYIKVVKDEPTKDKSNFLGWTSKTTGATGPYKYGEYLSGQTYNFLMPGENVTLTPKMENDKAVIYNANEPGGLLYTATNVPESEYYKPGATNVKLNFDSIPKLKGYLFLGWSTNKAATSPTYTADGKTTYPNALNADLTLYAVWIKVGNVVYDPNYTVGTQQPHMPTDETAYRPEIAGLDTVTVLFEDEDGFTPQREGSIFLGWSTDKDAKTATFTKTGLQSFRATDQEMRLYAVWKRGYKVIYRDYLVGSDPSKDASWSRSVYDYQAYDEGEKVNVVNDTPAERDGYYFLGWSPEQNVAEPLFSAGGGQKFQIGASDYYLYAVWQPLFTVEYYDFEADGTISVRKAFVEPDGSVDLSLGPVNENFEDNFLGWRETENPNTDPGTNMTVLEGMIAQKDVKLIAVYSGLYQVKLHYNYTENGQEKVGVMLVPDGTKLDLASVFSGERAGHAFGGWYPNAAMTGSPDTSVTVTGNKELYAQWLVDQVTVNFHPNFGDEEENGKGTMRPQVITGLTSKLNKNQYVLDGYRFLGWATSPDGAVVFDNQHTVYDAATLSKLAENPDLYAVWQMITQSIMLEDGDILLRIETNRPGAAIPDTFRSYVPDAADYPSGEYKKLKRDCYDFVKWEYNIPLTMPSSDLHLKAIWEGKPMTLTLDPSCDKSDVKGISEYAKTVRYADNYDLPTPTRFGYYFNGWYDDTGRRITNDTKIERIDDHTLTARWTERKITLNLRNDAGIYYTLTADKFGDPNGNGVKKGFKLPTDYIRPENTDYEEFFGWYTDSDDKVFSPDGVMQVASYTDLHGELDLYEKWMKTFPLTLVSDDDTVHWNATVPAEMKTGYAISERKNYTQPDKRENERFLGWYDGDTLVVKPDGTLAKNTTLTGDTTLKAKWVPKNHLTLMDGTSLWTFKFQTEDSLGIGTVLGNYKTYEAPKRDKERLLGWFLTEAGDDAEPVVSADGKLMQSYTLAPDAKLYARWTPKNKLTLVNTLSVSEPTAWFSLFDGTDPVTADTKLKDYKAPKVDGKALVGWYNSANETDETAVMLVDKDGKVLQNITLTPDTKLYARWNDGFTLTLKDGGNIHKTFDGLTELTGTPEGYEAPTKTNWTLVGWYDDTNATTKILDSSGKVVSNKYETLSGDLTLYARWVKLSYETPQAGSYYLIVSGKPNDGNQTTVNALKTENDALKNDNSITVKRSGNYNNYTYTFTFDELDEDAVWYYNSKKFQSKTTGKYLNQQDDNTLTLSQDGLAWSNAYENYLYYTKGSGMSTKFYRVTYDAGWKLEKKNWDKLKGNVDFIKVEYSFDPS